MLERKAPPTFDVLIEIMEMDKLAIHHDVANIVDKMLRGVPPRPEIRVRNPEGEVEVVQASELGPRPRPEAQRFEHEPEFVGTRPLPEIVKLSLWRQPQSTGAGDQGTARAGVYNQGRWRL